MLSVAQEMRRRARASITGGRHVLRAEWDDQGVLAEISKMADAFGEDLNDIRRARGKESFEGTIYNRLGSPSAMVCCLIEAAERRDVTMSFAELKTLASSLRPWRDPDEPIIIKPQMKPNGEIRPTVRYGFKRLALALLVEHVLVAALGYPDNEWCRPGRGTHAAVAALKSIEGGDWFWSADVRNCFPSIRHDAVVNSMPLPENVLRNVVLIPETVSLIGPKGYRTSGSEEMTLRAGLPQGSPPSSLIVSHMIDQVVAPFAVQQHVMHYVDNLFGLCWHRSEPEALLDALGVAFLAAPFGELHLHDRTVARIEEGFDILGYWVQQPKEIDDRYAFVARPGIRAQERFLTELREDLAFLPKSMREQAAFDRTSDWLRGWIETNAGSAWTDGFIDRSLAVAVALSASGRR